jgi:two-component system cell cycle response regulator
MRQAMLALREELARRWRPPDQYLIDAAVASEVLIARVRLLLAGLLLVRPLIGLVAEPEDREHHLVAVRVILLVLLIALGAALAVEREFRRPWLPVASALLDVTLVSFSLLMLGLFSDPHRAVNSRVAFDLYFVAIAASSLRYDFRLTVLAGGSAVIQYLLLVIGVGAFNDLEAARYAPWTFGHFSWIEQLSRVILLGAATGVSGAVVLRLQQLRQESSSDRLTGLFNRAYFEEFLQAEIRRSKRYLRSFAVAMIDIDHFKRFNDTYGHATGDQALRTVAAILQREVRRSDLVARYGGEEMVLVMPETTLNAARTRLETIRQAISSEAIKVPRREEMVHMTVSAGVACWPHDGDNPDDLVHTADARLYHAKALGRNRVVSSSVAAASV